MSFLSQPPVAIADTLEQRLGALSENDIKHLFINLCNRIAQLEKDVADLQEKVFT
jgi:hypothetical protein